ncbi:hypothetical protein JTE90_001720 [Oedothorax gibbosus]|uniref:Uncharacterized protein n=1 Tax=Oedothorax gibbosus TaxID=931172 RepID=A0AAV6U1P3_9ARAC|nr:hypothetical protein JTE90_001720 [Oedothorax gibbosus]
MIDTVWMISHALQLPNVPMWVGFNCLLSSNDSLKQKVLYLTPINESPTNKSVVLETMKQSKKICEEVKQSSIQVTYDLAIAKIALQIQATQKPEFDNLFIHLGPFHIMMAYFKAVGKVIIDCGLTNVMVQSDLLASGSVNGFLEGKHFNRCKRLHPLVAVGLELLHFNSFLESKNVVVTEEMVKEISQMGTSSQSFKINDEELYELIHNYNIYKQQTLNGEFASEPVEKFLLNIEENGEIKRKTFFTECEQQDDGRFEESIKKTPINNFSIDYAKKRKTKLGGKVQEVRVQRDFFGRILGISIDNKVDMAKIFSYPITPVPLSLCHFDGAICKTQKSILMKCLETGVEHDQPSHIDIVVIDGFFVLHTMKNVPKTFGCISKKNLQMVTQLNAKRYDVIFDQYFSPSIKDYERFLRHESTDLEFTITGPDQVRPSDFAKELKNIRFKQALADFLILHWSTDEMVPFIGNKNIVVNFKKCHSFTVINNAVVSDIDESLTCPDHEEADTKIIHHICNIDAQSNFVIRCSDTDIAAIMLGNMRHLKHSESHVWMLIGVGNKVRYVDITTVYEQLGPSLSRCLPGFHAITGCDYNPAFFKKRQAKAIQYTKEK